MDNRSKRIIAQFSIGGAIGFSAAMGIIHGNVFIQFLCIFFTILIIVFRREINTWSYRKMLRIWPIAETRDRS